MLSESFLCIGGFGSDTLFQNGSMLIYGFKKLDNQNGIFIVQGSEHKALKVPTLIFCHLEPKSHLGEGYISCYSGDFTHSESSNLCGAQTSLCLSCCILARSRLVYPFSFFYISVCLSFAITFLFWHHFLASLCVFMSYVT